MTKNIDASSLDDLIHGLLFPKHKNTTGKSVAKAPKYVQQDDYDFNIPELSHRWKDMPVNHLNTWTKEEDAKLRVEIARERSVGTIALLHHRTKTAIRFRLKHLGLEENRPYLLVKGDMDENDDDDDLLG